MKTAFIAFLVVAIAALGIDDYMQRASLKQSQQTATAMQAQADQEAAQITDLQHQAEEMQGRIAGLVLKLKPTAPAISAAPLPAPTPPPAAATPAPAPAPAARTASQLATDYSSALVIIEGKNAVGSGFLCNMDGHTYVITNAHVLADNPEFKITNITGKVFTPGSSAVAVAHDVVKIEVTGADKAFDVMTDIDHNAKIGDAVVVLGNAEGAGVVKPVEGKIVGLGPDLIETDAAFVKGNSGSPIIHVASGKVLGVATYLLEHKVAQGQGQVQTEIRRFGYKLDGIAQWEAINWQAFYAQSAQLTAMETLSDDFIRMFGNAQGLNFDPTNYSTPALQRSIRNFLDAARQGGRTMSDSDRKVLVERFLGDLRSVAHSDILAFKKNTAYDYFRREVDDQSQFRDDLYQDLSRAMENVQ